MSAALLSLLLVSGALADDKYLARASALVDDAEYRRAQRVIARGLARPGLTGDVLAGFFALDGECALARGRKRAARSAFVKVLTVRPGFRFGPNRSPKLRELLEAVRAELVAAGELAAPYAPEHVPLGAVRARTEAEVTVAFRGPAAIDRVVLYTRPLGASAFQAVDAQYVLSTWSARLPEGLLDPSVDDAAAEYWLAGFDRGERVVVVGSDEQPFQFLVLSDEALAAGDEELEDPFPVVPVAIGAAAAAVVIAAVTVGIVFALQPQTGRAVVGVSSP